MKGQIFFLHLLVLLLILIVSCNKTNYSNSTGTTTYYYGYVYYNFQPFRAFVNKGEILDTNVLNELYTRENPFFTQTTISSEAFVYDSIYFLGNDTAVVFATSLNVLNNPYIVQQNSDGLVLTSLVSSQVERDTSIQTRVDSMELLYTPLLTNGQYLGGGYYQYNFTNRAYASQVSSSELAVPCMISCFQTPASVQQSQVFNNRFNPNFQYQLLPAGDTLCIRECTERMLTK